MANIHTFSSLNKNNNNSNRAPSSQGGRYATLSSSSPSNQDTSGDSGMFSINMPDETGNFQKVNLLHVLFPGFKVKSFVFYLSMFQIALFLITRVWGWAIDDPNASSTPKHTSPLDQDQDAQDAQEDQEDQAFNCVLYKFGAKFTPAIIGLYQIQRLLLPVFLHAGFGHVFFNMLSQWFYGFHLEQLYTTKKFVILYFASAIGGNLLSGIQNTDNISVGASSALFGIFAFQVAYLIENYENLGPRKNVQIFVIALMLLANVGSASKTAKVDNSAHLGILRIFVGPSLNF